MSYVIAGYGISLAALTAYTWRTLHRGRVLSRSLPPTETGRPERRPWE
ncbi:MAG: hypothetical protein QOG64_2069 [Acidimicrobiaceae bacterium]|jgi:hypothetical protein|nr:hypothetical protein [Acidimicrobiaceae bacterium]